MASCVGYLPQGRIAPRSRRSELWRLRPPRWRARVRGDRRRPSQRTSIENGGGERLRCFLRQVVPDTTGQFAVLVFAREPLGVGSGRRMRRAVGIALERDAGTAITGPFASLCSSASYCASPSASPSRQR